ncbi:MAG: DinB family protein [Gemmatimonadales bacterium]
MQGRDGAAMVSQDIQDRREAYLEIMHAHGTKSPAEISASIRETQSQLLDVLNGWSDADALWKPAPAEWCIRDLALHAMFTERLVAKLVHYTARGAFPPAADLAGAGIGMMPADDGRAYRQVLDDLRAANDALIETVGELRGEPDVKTQATHPFFGPLNCLEWAGFQRVHDLDHIQHAEKIRAGYAR